MAQIQIDLDEKQYQNIKDIIYKNKREDLENETFSGIQLIISITPFGHFLDLKTEVHTEIGEVRLIL